MSIEQDLSKLFKIACNGDSTVLITGGTGTGKTALAKKIHNQSKRRLKPFISVNLATLHEGVLESELFGHEKGSFTGAEQRRVGRLELAQGGTVFLDEVGELTPRLQARLLEFLQSRTIALVGSNREVQLDVRVIAATHKNLSLAVKNGDFREDLFHRLRVVSIGLKSLKDRADEFDHLVHTCLQEVCGLMNRSILRISEGVAQLFETYGWPGNLRELRNVLEYAVSASSNNEITLDDLPCWLFQEVAEESQASPKVPVLGQFEVPLTLDYQTTFEFFDKEYFRRALSRNGGRVARTARQIGLNKTTFMRRVRVYGLIE